MDEVKQLLTATAVYDGCGIFDGLVKYRRTCKKLGVSPMIMDKIVISGVVAELMAFTGILQENRAEYIKHCMNEFRQAFTDIDEQITKEGLPAGTTPVTGDGSTAPVATAPVTGEGFVIINAGEDLGKALDQFLGEMFGERRKKENKEEE